MPCQCFAHTCPGMSATDAPDMYNSPAMKKHAASVMNTVGAAVRLNRDSGFGSERATGGKALISWWVVRRLLVSATSMLSSQSCRRWASGESPLPLESHAQYGTERGFRFPLSLCLHSLALTFTPAVAPTNLHSTLRAGFVQALQLWRPICSLPRRGIASVSCSCVPSNSCDCKLWT